MGSSLYTLRRILSDRNILVLTLSEFISALSFRLWMPYWSLYALDLGASKEVLGLLSVVQAGSVLVCQIPGGLLADRLGRKKVIVFFTVFEILTPLLYMLARSWPHLVFGAISQSMSWACMPALNAIVVESLPEDIRGTGIGIYRLVTWLPRMVMEFVGGVVLDYLGLARGFSIILTWSIVASILILAVRAWGLYETLGEGDRCRGGHRLKLNIFDMPQSMLALIAIGGISSFAARMAMPFVVVYAVEVIGLTKSEWGLVSMVSGILSVTLSSVGGALSDRIGRKPCLLASRLIEPASRLGFIHANNFLQALAVQSFSAIGRGIGGGLIMKGLLMGGPAWQALVADIVPPSDRGRIMGAMGSAQILLGLPSSWVGGYLWDNYAPEVPFYASTVMGFIAPLILYAFIKESKEK